jgi:hypothetical protein
MSKNNDQKELELNEEDSLFILLNIIGHDVIHDFRNPNERWSVNSQYIDNFYSTYTLTSIKGGSESDTNTNEEHKKKKQKIDDNNENDNENDNKMVISDNNEQKDVINNSESIGETVFKKQKINNEDDEYIIKLQEYLLLIKNNTSEFKCQFIMVFYFYLYKNYFNNIIKKGGKNDNDNENENDENETVNSGKTSVSATSKIYKKNENKNNYLTPHQEGENEDDNILPSLESNSDVESDVDSDVDSDAKSKINSDLGLDQEQINDNDLNKDIDYDQNITTIYIIDDLKYSLYEFLYVFTKLTFDENNEELNSIYQNIATYFMNFIIVYNSKENINKDTLPKIDLYDDNFVVNQKTMNILQEYFRYFLNEDYVTLCLYEYWDLPKEKIGGGNKNNKKSKSKRKKSNNKSKNKSSKKITYKNTKGPIQEPENEKPMKEEDEEEPMKEEDDEEPMKEEEEEPMKEDEEPMKEEKVNEELMKEEEEPMKEEEENDEEKVNEEPMKEEEENDEEPMKEEEEDEEPMNEEINKNKNFVDSVKLYMENTEFKDLIDKMDVIIKANIENIQRLSDKEIRNDYNNLRNELINNLKKLYTINPKYANGLANITLFSRPNSYKFNLLTNTKKIIEGTLIKAEAEISFYERNDELIKAKKERIKEKIKQKEEEEEDKKKKKIAKKILKDQKDHGLSGEQEIYVEQFMSFIAKSVLTLTNICNTNGKIIYKNTDNKLLDIEINILLIYANWNNINNPKNDKNSKYGIIKNKDLDNNLYDYWKEYYNNNKNQETKEIIVDDEFKIFKKNNIFNNNKIPNKFIINNAAAIGSYLSSKVFCPNSSIMDGMSNCSYNTAFRDGKEWGDMNFKIKNINDKNNNEIYYNGQVKLNENDEEKITIEFDIKIPQISFNNKLDDDLKDLDKLEASRVLQNTLISLLNYIVKRTEDDQSFIDGLFTNDSTDFFNNLYKKANITKENLDIYKEVFNNILFKVVGDLFQEINAVCKWGGYTMNNYKTTKEVISYKNTTGDQLRFFVANDRPSGCRFLFFLNNGRKEQINLKAIGGVFLDKSKLVVKRNDNKILGGSYTMKSRSRTSKRNKYLNKYKTVKNKKKIYKNKSKKNRNIKRNKFVRSIKV